MVLETLIERGDRVMRTVAYRVALVLLFMAPAIRTPAVTPESDAEIEHNAELLLKGDVELGHLPIRISVENGKAVLEGKVRLLHHAWRAREIVARAKGLTSIESRIEVDAGGRTAEAIAQEIQRKLQDQVGLASSPLEVKVDGGKAILTGTVKDARKRFIARDAAAETPGILDVEDRIESATASDEQLTNDVKKVLGPTSYDRIRGDIRPSVKDGIVTLEGKVARLSARFEAEHLVLGINGVRGVENKLEVAVRPPPGSEF